MLSDLALTQEGKGLFPVGSLGRLSWSGKESLLSLALPRADWLPCCALSPLSCTVAVEP